MALEIWKYLLMVVNIIWIEIALPLRIGFEPKDDIRFEVMIVDVLVDLLFFIHLIIGFFTPV